MVIGEPSPHAAEIGGMGWRRFASLSFNYRTKGEVLAVRHVYSALTMESR